MYKLYKIIYTCIIVMLVLSKKRGTQHHHHLSSKTANLATQSCFPFKKKKTIGSLLNQILFSDFCPDFFVEDAENHKFFKMTFSSLENWWIF